MEYFVISTRNGVDTVERRTASLDKAGAHFFAIADRTRPIDAARIENEAEDIYADWSRESGLVRPPGAGPVQIVGPRENKSLPDEHRQHKALKSLSTQCYAATRMCEARIHSGTEMGRAFHKLRCEIDDILGGLQLYGEVENNG